MITSLDKGKRGESYICTEIILEETVEGERERERRQSV